MYAATTSVALVGGEARPVEVQVHVGRPQESFKLSGLADTAVREAKDRVRAAVASSGMQFPNRTVTVNLAPADLPKGGTDYDLPIAIGVLAAAREVPSPRNAIVVGELALDGSVRPGSSTLGAGVLSARSRLPCVVARVGAADAAAVPGATVYGVESLAETVSMLRQGLDTHQPADARPAETDWSGADMSDIRGQPFARRAAEVAAAGSHHLLLHGPPGGGKTMLARRFPGILPPLDESAAVEVALIHAAGGVARGLQRRRPFQAPHHTASRAALVGGGSGMPVPGAVSLAHHGVLFLDELAEFSRGNLDTLRQPLEDGSVTIARKGAVVRFPSSFQLIAATNPCPCGYLGDRRRPCECRPAAVTRYRRRVSGPLLDRIDLMVNVPRVEASDLESSQWETSAQIRSRVTLARELAATTTTAIEPAAGRMILAALDKGLVTARGVSRLRRVAGTIANLAEEERVGEGHVAEAMSMRVSW